MAERENSVLFSLKELRNIEEDRVKQEEDTKRSQIEEERRARDEAIRRTKEEEERKVIAERDRVERLGQEKERQIREERMRVEETERKARVEAAARLEEARIHAEVHAAASAKKAPTGAILGGVGAVLAIGIAVVCYVFFVVIPNRDAENERRHVAEQERAVKMAVQQLKDQLSAEYDAKIAETKDASEKARLIAEKRSKQQAQEAAIMSRSRPRPAGPVKKKTGLDDLKGDPNDPLGGLKM